MNSIKPTQSDINFLINLINHINIIENNNDSNEYIEVPEMIKEIISQMKIIKPSLNEIDNNLESLINKYDENQSFSLRKLKQLYFDEYGVNISHTKINNILRKKLNYSFLKTAVKRIELTQKKYITMSYFFLKIILKCLKMEANLVFIDESRFFTYNPNYKAWRNSKKDIYYKINNKQKLNLIMAVNRNKIIHYEITDSNTTSNIFLNFLKSMMEKLSDDDKKITVLIMDNLSSHLTKELFEFYYQKKMKVVFNVPYLSKFNMIELCFRAIKNKTYKKLFKNKKELQNEIQLYIENDYLKNILPKFYREKLNNYLDYINNNLTINLN